MAEVLVFTYLEYKPSQREIRKLSFQPLWQLGTGIWSKFFQLEAHMPDFTSESKVEGKKKGTLSRIHSSKSIRRYLSSQASTVAGISSSSVPSVHSAKYIQCCAQQLQAQCLHWKKFPLAILKWIHFVRIVTASLFPITTLDRGGQNHILNSQFLKLYLNYKAQ